MENSGRFKIGFEIVPFLNFKTEHKIIAKIATLAILKIRCILGGKPAIK